MPEPSRKSSGFAPIVMLVVVVLALLLLAYPLSVGPAVWLLTNEYLSRDVYVWVYQPLGWFCENVPPAGDLMSVYLRLWVPD